MASIAVVLSGCGFMDGAEIHESVMTLWAIEKHGATYQCFAPNILQDQVINHLSGQVSDETRNVLVESARIARGNILNLEIYQPKNFDALVFPGGYGVVKHLSSFAYDGAECSPQSDVEKAVVETHRLKKPIGAMCIAPVLLARLISRPTLTIGQDEATIEALGQMGAVHKKTKHGQVVIDPLNRLVTTPCYMLDAKTTDIATDADGLIQAIIAMI